MNPKLVEEVARAICQEFYGTAWENTSEYRRGICAGIAQAAIRVCASRFAEIAKVGWLSSKRTVIGDADRESALCEEIESSIKREGGLT